MRPLQVVICCNILLYYQLFGVANRARYPIPPSLVAEIFIATGGEKHFIPIVTIRVSR